VLINLVGNAIKFTRTGSVQVAAHLAAEHGRELTLELAVRDTGVGVPEIRRGQIFTAFANPTAGGPGDDAGDGLGVGLAICKQLVELMGGALTVADNPGGGSVFHFSARLERVAEVRTVSGRLRVLSSSSGWR
jgi:signal transduction histidine kinase